MTEAAVERKMKLQDVMLKAMAKRITWYQAEQAHELLRKGAVTGKIVLLRNGSSLESGAA
jgi:hypothetical protein